MDVLFIGQNVSGKTTNMKKYINHLSKIQEKTKTIVLDFSNQFNGFSENVLFLDDINPLLEEININDVKALNAGYLSSSRCLLQKTIEIIEEQYLYFDDKDTVSFEEFLVTYKKIGLLEDGFERLQYSIWDKACTSYAKILSRRIPFKKQEKHTLLSNAISSIKENDVTILKSKSMHSDQLRAISFILLSRISLDKEFSYNIICDELSLFFNNGNIKMFDETINRTNLNFIVSFNKCSNIPKDFFKSFDTYFIHCFENNSEIKELNKMGIHTNKDLKKLPIGSFVKLVPIKTEEEAYV